MRVQLNPNTESYVESIAKKIAQQNLSKTQLSILKIKHYKIDDLDTLYICPSCNAELYGVWCHTYFERNLDDFEKRTTNDIIVCSRFREDFKDKYYNFHREDLKIREEIHKIYNMTHCPICDSKLNRQIPFALSGTTQSLFADDKDLPAVSSYEKNIKNIWDYFPERRRPFDIDGRFSTMFGILRDNEFQISKNEADMFAKSCDIIQPNQAPNDSLKNSVENLKNYIFNLINLESNIVSLTKRLGQLYYERTQNTKEVRFQRNYPLYGLKLKLQDKKTLLENSQKELTALGKKKVKPEIVYYPTAPTKPILKTPNFFNKKRVTLENEQLMAKYEKELGRYNEKVEQCNKQEKENIEKARKEKEAAISKAKNTMEKYRSEVDSIKKEINEKAKSSDSLPVPAIGVKHLLDSEISITEETLRKLYNCRNQLYSYNIIFDKYRNIVALSSFYEYLMAGRCETLEGVNGAYNIYESEIRMDQIISQLDEVIVSLDQIKKNQYMIYRKLEEMNSSLHNLENSMKKVTVSLDEIKVNTDNMNKYLDSIEKNTAVIAHNSAVTAYYSKVNAELTNALGFMVALK